MKWNVNIILTLYLSIFICKRYIKIYVYHTYIYMFYIIVCIIIKKTLCYCSTLEIWFVPAGLPFFFKKWRKNTSFLLFGFFFFYHSFSIELLFDVILLAGNNMKYHLFSSFPLSFVDRLKKHHILLNTMSPLFLKAHNARDTTRYQTTNYEIITERIIIN